MRQFFASQGALGLAPALSHIGLRGVALRRVTVAIGLCSVRLATDGSDPAKARLSGLSCVARFRIATVRRCRGHGSAGFYSLAFLRKSHPKTHKKVRKKRRFFVARQNGTISTP